MTECNKTTTVAELPSCDSVSSDSYLIVQGENAACKVKISDLVLSNENVDFYSQIEALVQKVNDLTAIVQANSGDWNDTSTLVDQNKDIWNAADGITNITTRLDAGENKWNEVATNVEVKSADWENTYQVVDNNRHAWQNAYDIVSANQNNWNTAYTITIDGLGAIHEALEMINSSPWFQHYTDGLNGSGQPTFAQVTSMWAAHQLHLPEWNSVYTTVLANSSGWANQ